MAPYRVPPPQSFNDDLLMQYLMQLAIADMMQGGQQQQQPPAPDLSKLGATIAGLTGAGAAGGAAGGAASGGALGGLSAASQAAWNAGGMAASGASTAAGGLGSGAAATGGMSTGIGGGMSAAGGASSGAGASTAGLGGLGLGLGTALGLGGVAAYYGPSAYKHGKAIASGKATADNQLKGVMMTNPVTAWAVPITDALGIGVKAGKHKDQLMRDKVRDALVEKGILNKNFEVELPGGKFNVGLDGGGKYKGGRPYNIDDSDPRAAEAAGLANPFSAIFTGKNKKLQNDFAGYFGNAIMSGGDIKKNARALYDKAGLTQRQAYDILNENVEDTQVRAAYHNAINQAFGNGGFDASGNIINSAGTTTMPKPPTPTSIPRTGKAPPGYKPGPLKR